ncbi:dihydropteroate synthase [soil metagenome]
MQNNVFYTNKTLNVSGKLIDLRSPAVMGILNVTPDSFYDGGKFTVLDNIRSHVNDMLKEGAMFIDVGGYSSRPGAIDISEKEESERVLPVLELIVKEFPQALVSIDTFRSTIARHAIEAGASVINDISGGDLDEKMFETVASLKVPYILMHMRGTPQTMKGLTQYEDLIKEMIFYFREKIQKLHQIGVTDVIVDPGFGFAKTIEQSFEILHHLDAFQVLGKPILAGLSRKSMIWKTLGTDAKGALNGTTALNSIALSKGANILRVHDVKEAVECARLFEKI